MRRKIRKSPEKIQDLDRAMPIFDLPVSAAFALSILVVPSIYPQAPRLVQAVMGAIALVPTIKILRRLLHSEFLSGSQRAGGHVFRRATPGAGGLDHGGCETHLSRTNAGRLHLSLLADSKPASQKPERRNRRPHFADHPRDRQNRAHPFTGSAVSSIFWATPTWETFWESFFSGACLWQQRFTPRSGSSKD